MTRPATAKERASYPAIRPVLLAYLAAGVLFSAIVEELSVGTVLLGGILAWLVHLLAVKARAGALGIEPVRRLLRMLAHFLVDLTISNLQLAWDVVTPRDLHRVKMVRVPVDDLTPNEITFLCHRITLTPGTLACSVDPAKTEILVHVMYPREGEDMGLSLRKPIDILKGRA